MEAWPTDVVADGDVPALPYQLEAKLARLDHLFPPEETPVNVISSASQGLSVAPDATLTVTQTEYESDNLSESGQAYENAAETAAMLLEEKTLGCVSRHFSSASVW